MFIFLGDLTWNDPYKWNISVLFLISFNQKVHIASFHAEIAILFKCKPQKIIFDIWSRPIRVRLTVTCQTKIIGLTILGLS